MPELPFYQIDAFSDRPLAGNPCAVVLDADGLDADTMLAVAREMNLSETSFVRRSARADVGARYFTPLGEIPMAGHPTVATLFALVEAGRVALTGALTRVTLELPAGVLPVELEARDGRVTRITMSQRQPEFGEPLDPARVLPALGLAPDDALPGLPVSVVSTGTPQLLVGVRGLDAVRRARPAPGVHVALARELGFFSSHVFALAGVAGGQTFARHFAPGEPGFEDPFTGSATGSMAALLFRHGRLGPRFVAEQGHWLGRPGRAEVEVVGRPDAIEAVRVGGGAATVLRGVLVI